MRSSFQNNALGSHVYWSGGIPPDDIIECCSSGGVHALVLMLSSYEMPVGVVSLEQRHEIETVLISSEGLLMKY